MELVIALLELVLPAVFILTTLFGLLARGDPKPGGVALFFRVGIVGTILSGLLVYLAHLLALQGGAGQALKNAYLGLFVGSGALIVMAAFGAVLKKQR